MSTTETFSPRRISCIINPNAANRRWRRNRLLRWYLQNRLPGRIYDDSRNRDQTVETVRRLCRDNDIIIAAGGDGTISDVIQGILDSGRAGEVALGILPFGSGNAFRIALGIPLNIGRAIRIIEEGRPKHIDLIDFGGRVATFGSIGATAQVLVEKLKHPTPGLVGHVLASRIMLKLAQKEQEVELFEGLDERNQPFEHRSLKLKVFDAYIGKTNHFGYGWTIAPEARIDDGYIDITFFEISNWKYMLYFPSIYFGHFQKTQRHFKARRIVFRGNDLPAQYNGELLGKLNHIELKILPKAIQVITPLN